jgi:hypothetical protein
MAFILSVAIQVESSSPGRLLGCLPPLFNFDGAKKCPRARFRLDGPGDLSPHTASAFEKALVSFKLHYNEDHKQTGPQNHHAVLLIGKPLVSNEEAQQNIFFRCSCFEMGMIG